MKSVRPWGTARRILAAWLVIVLIAPLCCCQVRLLAETLAGDKPSCCAHSQECTDGQDQAPGEPCQDCHGIQPRLADGGQPTLLLPTWDGGVAVVAPIFEPEASERPVFRMSLAARAVDDRRPPGWRLTLHCALLI